MNGEEFLQEHAKWKYGTKATIQEESPCTWLMSKTGYYFPYTDKDRLDSRLGMLCIFINATSFTMRAEQAVRMVDRTSKPRMKDEFGYRKTK